MSIYLQSKFNFFIFFCIFYYLNFKYQVLIEGHFQQAPLSALTDSEKTDLSSVKKPMRSAYYKYEPIVCLNIKISLVVNLKKWQVQTYIIIYIFFGFFNFWQFQSLSLSCKKLNSHYFRFIYTLYRFKYFISVLFFNL